MYILHIYIYIDSYENLILALRVARLNYLAVYKCLIVVETRPKSF